MVIFFHKASIYQCKDKGEMKLLQAYVDSDVSFIFILLNCTVSYVIMLLPWPVSRLGEWCCLFGLGVKKCERRQNECFIADLVNKP